MGNCFGQTEWSWKRKFRRSNSDDQDPIIEEENGENEGSIFRIRFKKRSMDTKKLINRILTNRPVLSSRQLNYVAFGQGAQPQPRGPDISLQYLDAKSLLMVAREDKQMQYREFGNTVTANSSQYSSSLDLEWENEYEGAVPSTANQMLWINIRQPGGSANPDHRSVNIINDKSPSSFSSESSEKKDNSIECSAKINEKKTKSWSHISTPDSMELEWDVVAEDNQLKSEECDSVDLDTRDLLYEIEQLKNRALRETGQFDYDLNKYPDMETS